jgi:competence protein ComEA
MRLRILGLRRLIDTRVLMSVEPSSANSDRRQCVKQNRKLQVSSYRRLCGLLLLTVSAGLFLSAAVTSTSVDARQAVGPSATTDKSSAHPEFPPGEGREAVMRLCTKCHSPNIILASGRDRVGWENTITKMVRLGATGDDEDFTDIADYLTAHFPPSAVQKIFVNMATAKDFASVLGISEDDGKAIVDYRDKQKGFKTIEEMEKVPGIDAQKVEAKKDRLVF